jgi:hypothetical protein
MSLAIGIDTDDAAGKNRVRMVILAPDLQYPYVLAYHSFRSLKKFEQYWGNNNWLECKPSAGASPGTDPLGVLAWLRDRGVPVNQSFLERHDVEQEFLMRDLPGAYRWAFSYAFREVYRLQGPQSLEQIWLRLLALRQELGAIVRELGHCAHEQPR